MGRLDEAREIVKRLRAITPVVIPSVIPYRNPEHRELFLSGLRLACGRDDMTQTRRLAAILAADVAGYSRLMGADEEGTLERLKLLRRELVDPKIAEHRGRIVKTTATASSWNLRAWLMLSAAQSRCSRLWPSGTPA